MPGNIEDPSVYLEGFDYLVQKGSLRAYGISTNDLSAVKKFNQDGNCSVVQVDYSLLNRQPSEDLLPYCESEGIAVMVRGPLAKGLLSGKYNKASNFSDIIRAGFNPDGGEREEYESMLISLSANKADEVKGYSLNFQTLRRGLSKEKFNIWFNNGIRIINLGNNAEAYFSLDNPESKALFNELTFSVDLDIEKDILKLYCCALSGQELGVQSSNIMVDKEIGWFNSNLATTEGSTIYLPESIKKFPERDKNFSWLIAATTNSLLRFKISIFDLSL